MAEDKGLVEIVAGKSFEKIRKGAFGTGLAAQIALPNIAFISDMLGSGYAEKLYEYSKVPYVLIGAVAGGMLYYLGGKIR